MCKELDGPGAQLPLSRKPGRRMCNTAELLRVVELPASTRSAKDAAAALDCEVAQIAKSLIFKGQASGDPVLVVASGANRVDEDKVAQP